MSNILVCYFSATGVTRSVAINICKSLNCDLFEIEPKIKYTDNDLNWMDKQSRSSIEMKNLKFRPKVLNKVSNLNNYDTIILGFPVWWYTAPTIINSFIEENDLSLKKIYVFVTSGSSSEVKSFNDLKNEYPYLNFISCKRFTGFEESDIYKLWIK